MSETDDLFNDAYRLHVVEERHQEAIDLCRRSLEADPENYRARVFLGMLLGDHGNENEVLESRQCFLEAIKSARSASLFCTTWPEEAAIHHLGIWEWRQGHQCNACLFFLVDFLACNNEASGRYLFEVLNKLDSGVATDIKLLLVRLKNEYQFKLKAE